MCMKQRIKKRGGRHPLPTITFSNTRSLRNKFDELIALSQYDCHYRQSNLLCFTETWFKSKSDENDDDYDKEDEFVIPGYVTVRADRINNRAKKKGRCVCL